MVRLEGLNFLPSILMNAFQEQLDLTTLTYPPVHSKTCQSCLKQATCNAMASQLCALLEKTTYAKQNICDNTLDDAQLESRCPLDNTRCINASVTSRCSVGQLDQLPFEILTQVLLYADIPSLPGFTICLIHTWSDGSSFYHDTRPHFTLVPKRSCALLVLL